jgi:azurin
MKHLLCPALILAAGTLAFADTPPSPVTVTIKTKPAQMKYDLESIDAAPGAKVTVTLDNEDDLPHNFVLCKRKEDGSNDKGLEVAMLAWNMGEAGMKKDWIPDSPRVLAHSKMVNPHEKETITFTAPETAADYPFVCTFPGHALVMNGTLRVSQPMAPLKNLHYRYYVAEKGQSLTKLPELAKLKAVEEGQLPAGKIDLSMHAKDRKADFAYEFEGELDCPKEGDYTFHMGSDDGSRLWIDGREVLNMDGVHPPSFKDKKVKLKKGEHKVLIHYFQGGGGAEFYLTWSGPGFNENWLSAAESSDHPKKNKKNNKDDTEGIPLIVDKEARIYRNFIVGSSPRGIAVGYPGGVNLCWDADQMSLALVWQGAFIDAKRHWTGRGVGDQPPLGYGVAKLGMQRSLGILASQTDPWVAPYKKDQMRDMAYTFRGYELDEKRQPTFRWEFNGVKVTEIFEPSGDYKKENASLKRVVKLSANSLVENLYFLALTGPVDAKDGAFFFDKTIKVTLSGAEPLVRKDGGKSEVLIPVVFKNGTAEITMNYSWSVK